MILALSATMAWGGSEALKNAYDADHVPTGLIESEHPQPEMVTIRLRCTSTGFEKTLETGRHVPLSASNLNAIWSPQSGTWMNDNSRLSRPGFDRTGWVLPNGQRVTVGMTVDQILAMAGTTDIELFAQWERQELTQH